MILKRIIAFFLILIIPLFFAGELFAADDIGMVFMARGSVSATRGGQAVSLAVKDKIYANDVINTGAGAKAQLLLNDETSITLGENTTLEMSEFANTGKESRFSARLGKGLMRVITGEITKNNPEGFKITTPRATVGIRGTIVVIRVDENRETVTVLNSEFTVLVNGVEVPQDSTVTIGEDGSVTVEPLTQEQKDAYNEEAAGGGDAADNGTALEGVDSQALADAGVELFANGGLGNNDLDLTMTTMFEDWTDLALNPPDDLTEPDIPLPDIPLPDIPLPDISIASITGDLASDIGNPFSGKFSFNIDLLNGSVTDAVLQGSGSVIPLPLHGGALLNEAAFAVNFNGGSGWFINGAFDISNFGGTAAFDGKTLNGLENSYMNGGIDAGNNVNLSEYAVFGSDYLYDVGHGSGTAKR
ncbi:hypothetical protein FACS1894216_19390 [Synergistales bacterium]|nr:hypothetical protein FACS1894216_19390 [Synergistales bacterium]